MVLRVSMKSLYAVLVDARLYHFYSHFRPGTKYTSTCSRRGLSERLGESEKAAAAAAQFD